MRTRFQPIFIGLLWALPTACGSSSPAQGITSSGGRGGSSGSAGSGGSSGNAGSNDASGGAGNSAVSSAGSSASGGGNSGGSSGSNSSAAGSGGAGGASGAAGTCAGMGVAVAQSERMPNGNPVLPPKWAFGVLWGSYYDQAGLYVGQEKGDLLAAAMRLRTEGYGGDLQWVDSSAWWHDFDTGGQYYVCFTLDPQAFPDPKTMISTLQQEHFHFGVWEWPAMGHGCQYVQDGVSKGYFTTAANGDWWHGDTDPYQFDFTNPAAQAWWVGLNQPLVDMGLDFMKLDTQYGTPAYRYGYHSSAYQVTQKYAEAHDPDAMLNGARGFIMAIGDGSANAPNNDQVPGMWTHDTSSDWVGFNADVSRAKALDSTDSAAYWCGDTGGFNDKTTDEQYTRWFEYSAFTPLQEFFGGKAPGIGARFPWLFGPGPQATVKTYLRLRYRLLPFRYSNAQAAYHVKPVKYPVAWNGDAIVLAGDGDSAILTQPVMSSTTTASVNLPAGNWIHYWTGTSYTGTANVPAPLEQAPIFVKAGSIIPMGPDLQWVDEKPADPLTLDIYPSGATSYTLYEDDGVSLGYMGGAYATTKFSSDDTTGHEVVSIDAQQTAKYAYSGQLCSRRYILKINGRAAAPSMVTRDGNTVPMSSAAAFSTTTEGWYYDPVAKIVWAAFPLLSSSATKVSLVK
jgi:alpha-glucosidase